MRPVLDITFSDADEAHRAHLASDSHAQHLALGEFYEAVRSAADAFVEASIALDLPVPQANNDMLARLEESYLELTDNRDEACMHNPVLENLHDEIVGVYLKAIYALKRFVQP